LEHFLGQLNAVDTGDGWWMTVPEGLVFAPGSDELAAGTEPVVAQIAALIGYFGDAPVRIVGHTDSFGDAVVNKELSLQRAAAVGRQLVGSFGIDPRRLVTEGFGEEQPIASNATIEGRRANRRVEIYIKR
jgi:outer membrane protein OmpA-like peptidoglycan-associated protein